MTPKQKELQKNKKNISKATTGLILSLIVGVLYMSPSFLIDENAEWPPIFDSPIFVLLGVVAGVGIFLSIAFLLFFKLSNEKRINRVYCPRCGRKYDYEKDVAWEVDSISTGNTDQRARVDFTCRCGKCGEETSFSSSFLVASIDSRGNIKQSNLNSKIKEYFK